MIKSVKKSKPSRIVHECVSFSSKLPYDVDYLKCLPAKKPELVLQFIGPSDVSKVGFAGKYFNESKRTIKNVAFTFGPGGTKFVLTPDQLIEGHSFNTLKNVENVTVAFTSKTKSIIYNDFVFE